MAVPRTLAVTRWQEEQEFYVKGHQAKVHSEASITVPGRPRTVVCQPLDQPRESFRLGWGSWKSPLRCQKTQTEHPLI